MEKGWLWACSELSLLWWGIPCIPSPSRAFYHERILDFYQRQSIYASNEMIIFFLSFNLLCARLHWLIHMYWTISASLRWSPLDMVDNLFWYVFKFSFKAFYWYFCIYVHKGYLSIIFYSVESLCSLTSRYLFHKKNQKTFLQFLFCRVIWGIWTLVLYRR